MSADSVAVIVRTKRLNLVRVLYPDVRPAEAAEVILPHHQQQASTAGALGQPVGN